MNKDYKITNNHLEIFINSKIYSPIIIKKALYNFITNRRIVMDYIDNDCIRVKLHIFKHDDVDKLLDKIYEELYNESLRYDIMIQTKEIRELIIGRALYSACIDTKVNNSIKDEDYNIDDIAHNWFETGGNGAC